MRADSSLNKNIKVEVDKNKRIPDALKGENQRTCLDVKDGKREGKDDI